jgi:hypothetical protein
MRAFWVAMTVLVFLCVADGAAATVRHELVRGKQLTRIELEGSDGYSVLILSDRNQHLTVQTTKDAFITEYRTHDTIAGPDRMKAELPGLGLISVRLHLDGRTRRLPAFNGCVGPRPTLRKGVARGVIEFVGEREYTRAEAHEAPVEIEESKRQRCRLGAGPEPLTPGFDWTSRFSAGGPEASFLARKYRPGILEGGGRVHYLAETASRGESFDVYRRAAVVAPAATFPDAHPEHMTISPPPPFVGTGTVARTPESVFTWEGNLSIQFPGTDPLPLTSRFSGSDYCRREVGCIRQQDDYPGLG